jgi:hypothetical protein
MKKLTIILINVCLIGAVNWFAYYLITRLYWGDRYSCLWIIAILGMTSCVSAIGFHNIIEEV